MPYPVFTKILLVSLVASNLLRAAGESLPPLIDGKAPQTFEALWAGYDPRKEPLEIEVLKEWEEDGVVLRVVRYQIGVFKGHKAVMAAVYGFPKGGSKLPGLVQIHGGGQFADYKAPLTNAKRGYATISLAWAGRISAPAYEVDSDIVNLFIEGNTGDPAYKVTTDWKGFIGYHAVDRKNRAPAAFPEWKLDELTDSPRNSSWFMWELGARRALTFLEQQPEVNGDKLGVYGHSMGGKLTVMTAAADARVKAAAPSCGGVSARSEPGIAPAPIDDGVSLSHITCPIIFLSPANDFHGQIDDLQTALSEIHSKEWRVTCSAHGNHQDLAEFEVATQLWFDQCLKGSFQMPKTPAATLELKTTNAVPCFTVTPDASRAIQAVDIYYTQQGRPEGTKHDMFHTMSRFWHRAKATRNGDNWSAELPVLTIDKPLWVYANVLYTLDQPVTGAGYYYGKYTTQAFNLSSRMAIVSADQLNAAGVKATANPSQMIEVFGKDWQKEWFTYDLTDNWARSTHKIYDPQWQAPEGAQLAFSVRSAQRNKLVVRVDGNASEVALQGGNQWQQVVLTWTDFRDAKGGALKDWKNLKTLGLSAKETLKSKVDGVDKKIELGAEWVGESPEFKNLRWVEAALESQHQPIGAKITPAESTAGKFVQARFIAPPAKRAADAACPLFRKEFTLNSKPQSATLRIIGLGDYEVSLNGQPLAATAINQPWSEYEKTLYYRDFDLTPALGAGPNCLGVMLYNSFWHNPNPPAGRYNKIGAQRTTAEPYLLCAEITATQKDGTVVRIGTDGSWHLTDGPVIFSHIYAGEDFDARRQLPGWDRVGFDDRNWQTARETAAPAARLEPQLFPNVATFAHQKPVSIKPAQVTVPHATAQPEAPAMAEPPASLYTFPQNMAAQLRVELEGGKAGDRVSFRCGEHKNAQDRLFGNYVLSCEVITDGQPLTRQWGSFYVGMQFVEVTGAVQPGLPNPLGLPVVRSLELVDVRAALPEAGTFNTSSDLYNGTHRIIDAAMRANMSWVMTDCPHREKFGWLECSYLLAPSFQYRYDCRTWIAKIIRDVRDAQEPSGRVRTVAPGYPKFGDGFQWTVEWGATAALLPWRHYEWYGDVNILRDNFEMMRRFTDYIQTEAKDGLAPGGLGDWYDYGHGQAPGPSRFTPTNLSATATWALSARAVAQAAEVLGRPEEAKKYHALHARIAADFQRHFQDPVTRKLRHKGSPQCANAMALCAGVVAAADRALLVDDLIADLEKRNYQQTAGDVGHVYVIRALAEAGRSDVLHRVYSRDGVGSYGGILKKGLTSLPETWDAMMDGYQSLNHCMLGHVMEWYYGYVGGIRQPAGGIGWKKIIIAPNPGALTHAECTVETPAGRVVSRWRVDGKQFRLETEIPKGVEAVAILPSGSKKPLHSGKQTLTEPLLTEP